MQISQEYIAALVVILVTVLPRLGIQIGSVELTTFIQATITVVGGLWIIIRKIQKKEINIAGFKLK